MTPICLLLIGPRLSCLVLIGGQKLFAWLHHLTMLASAFFDDEAEVEGSASDDKPEEETSRGPPSGTGLFSSDEESDEKSENMTEASMHQAMDNSRRRDEDSDAEPLFLSPTVGR